MGLYQKYLFSGILIFLVVVLGLWFIMAETTPTDLYFEGNSTQNYDNDGVFSLNWSSTADTPKNFTVWVSNDGGSTWTKTSNDSVTGYQITDGANAQNYTFEVQGINATDYESANVSSGWMTVDKTNPLISYTPNADSAGGAANRTWVFVNISASDTNNDTIIFSLYNSTDLVNQTSYSDSYATLTMNWTDLPNDKVYYFNVTANDSATNTDSTATRTFYLDGTAPTASASCSPTTLYSGSSFPCTCSGSDATSGVSTTSGSSTSGTTSNTAETGQFTYTCTVTDNAGNSASATATYTVSSSGGAGPSISQPPRKIHSWTLITPGVAAIMRDFDSEIGVKQIRVRVRNEVQNVKITVTKYSAKPAEVSVAKTGKTYQYLHINAENFGEDIEQATVEFRAERTWAAGVGLGKNDLVVSRYNGATSRWDELTTTSTGEDATYYYYDVEVDGFSYFAISEKAVVSEEELVLGVEKSKLWLWILVAVAIIAVIVWQMKIKKK